MRAALDAAIPQQQAVSALAARVSAAASGPMSMWKAVVAYLPGCQPSENETGVRVQDLRPASPGTFSVSRLVGDRTRIPLEHRATPPQGRPQHQQDEGRFDVHARIVPFFAPRGTPTGFKNR